MATLSRATLSQLNMLNRDLDTVQKRLNIIGSPKEMNYPDVGQKISGGGMAGLSLERTPEKAQNLGLHSYTPNMASNP